MRREENCDSAAGEEKRAGVVPARSIPRLDSASDEGREQPDAGSAQEGDTECGSAEALCHPADPIGMRPNDIHISCRQSPSRPHESTLPLFGYGELVARWGAPARPGLSAAFAVTPPCSVTQGRSTSMAT